MSPSSPPVAVPETPAGPSPGKRTPASAELVPSGWFVARVPLLPFDEVLAWGRDVAVRPGGGLPACMNRPQVRDAVLLASPGLAGSFGSAVGRDARARDRADRALIRYFLRMTGRPTPFGLLATSSLGRVAPTTRLTVAPGDRILSRTRLDSGYVAGLGDVLAADVASHRRRPLRTNPTAYRSGDRVRYIEPVAGVDAPEGGFSLSSAAGGRPLLDALELAASGGVTRDDLVQQLRRSGHDARSAEQFVAELVAARLLLDDACESDRFAVVVRDRGDRSPYREMLAGVADLLRSDDPRGAPDRPEIRHQVATALGDLPGPTFPGSPFQVDALRPAMASSISPRVIAAVRQGIDALHMAGRPWRDPGLDRFRTDFIDRFGQRAVPLLDALDDESGVGYRPVGGMGRSPSPPDAARSGRGGQDHDWGPREDRLLTLLHRAWTERSVEVALTAEDLGALATDDRPSLPDACAALCSVLPEPEPGSPDGAASLYLDSVAGPSGVRLIGRICDLDADLEQAVRSHIAAEERVRPSAVYAEVVHCPDPRLGNVVDRPSLRHWEIPVFGGATVPPDRQIRLDDLQVSVSGDRIRLFSVALGRDVLPRMSNAHDFYAAGNLSLYTFLCALQNEGSAGVLQWSWEPVQTAPFLPRVRTGPVVLSRAQWNLQPNDLAPLVAAAAASDLGRLREVRVTLGLPHFVYVMDGDAGLLCDLENPRAVDAVGPLLRAGPGASMVEMYPDPTQLAATGRDGRFVHELIVPFERRTNGASAHLVPPIPQPQRQRVGHSTEPSDSPLRREFPPGSEWLYAKVYLRLSDADRFLRGPVAELLDDPATSGGAPQWFFVRYFDPEPHLRLRFRIDPPHRLTAFRGVLENLLLREFDTGRLRSLSYDTYRREVERYGGPDGMELAEQIFHGDSEAVLELLSHIAGDDAVRRRWATALVGVDRIFTAFAPRAELRSTIAAGWRESAEQQFSADRSVRAEILGLLRKSRRPLLHVLEGGADPSLLPAEVVAILHSRTARLRAPIESLRSMAATDRLSQPLESLAVSHAHMFLNRLLGAGQQRQELLLATFLDRLYASITARR